MVLLVMLLLRVGVHSKRIQRLDIGNITFVFIFVWHTWIVIERVLVYASEKGGFDCKILLIG